MNDSAAALHKTTAPVAGAFGPGFWIVSAVFLVSMAFTTIPTPLYSLYQAKDRFATYMITVVFSAYALGVVASLYLAGHLSDWFGRKPVLLVAVVAEIVSAALFLLWPETVGLIVARFISGAGVGVLTATATAYIGELRAKAKPDEGPAVAGLVSTVVNTGGLALGPLVSGFLAEYVEGPLVLPYAIFIGLLLIGFAALSVVPETKLRVSPTPRYHPQRVAVAPEARSVLVAASAGPFAGFAILGMFGSVAPSFVAVELHEQSRFVAGIVAFLAFGSGTLAQVVFRKLKLDKQLSIGVPAMCAGLVAVAAGVIFTSLAVFLAGGLIAGAGIGLVFRASIGTAAAVSAPENRGAVLALVFLVSYTGLAIPVVGLGIALQFVSSEIALSVFTSVFFAVALLAGLRMISKLRGR